MADKFWKIGNGASDHEEYAFWCAGCETAHSFIVKWGSQFQRQEPKWTFNGDMVRPTFAPSLLYHGWKSENPEYKGQPRCHLYLRDGVIEYLDDCEHKLKGQKVPLPEFP